ncbi:MULTISPECIES: hypothetical protein [Thermus]|nr:hypothetical protein [Thermus thalpophilus]
MRALVLALLALLALAAPVKAHGTQAHGTVQPLSDEVKGLGGKK